MIFYSFEGLMTNEFAGYENGPAGCAFEGSTLGSTSISGDDYLHVALGFERSHLWRNYAVLLSLFFFFLVLTMVMTERLKPAGANKAYLLYKNGGGGTMVKAASQHGEKPRDEEEAINSQVTEKPRGKADQDDQVIKDVSSSHTTFSWRKLHYDINGRKLLNDVEGYCKPGTLTALMGASGAGKTTLMDCLAQRKDEGDLKGEILINGKPLPVSFQRTTAFCEQNDIHQPEATVCESLEFSALLRQPRDIPDKEKLAYVDTIIDLLELGDIADALIGTPDAGLSIEQRKRLTIGVELVAKPLLLFLDEPTSGLDGLIGDLSIALKAAQST